MCTNVSKQKIYLKYGEIISSPTVSLKALFITMVIDTYERPNIGNFDILEAYLYSGFPMKKMYY